MKKTIYRLLGVSLLAAGVASCGSGSSSPTSTTATTGTTTTTTATATPSLESQFGTQFGIDYDTSKTANPAAVNSGDVIALTLSANPITSLPASNNN